MATSTSKDNFSIQVVEKLNGIKNFDNWRFCIKLIFEERRLWEIVNGDKATPADATAERKEYMDRNRKAMIILASNVEPSQMVYIKQHEYVKEAWAEINKVYTRNALANRIYLREKLRGMHQEAGENIEEYATRLKDLAIQLDGAGASVPDEELVLKLLESVLPKYRMLVTALEAQDGSLKFGEVVTKLQHEELRRHKKEEAGENAYMGRYQGRPNGKQQGKTQGKQQVKCFHCQKPGHFKRDCFKWKREQQDKARGVGGRESSNHHSASPAAQGNFAFQATSKSTSPDCTWYVDSGATKHMCSTRDAFSKLMMVTPEPVFMGNNAMVDVVGVGEVPITTVVDGKQLEGKLTNVLYVPDLATNLISVRQLISKGMEVTFAKDRCNIISPDGEVLGKAKLDGKLFKLQMGDIKGSNAAMAVLNSPAREAQLWHERYGHIGMHNLQILASKELARGLPKKISNLEGVCTGCMMGKQARESFPNEGKRATEALELVHSDLCGPMSVQTLGKAKYFLTFIDDATRFTYIFFLQSKDQVFSKFKEFKALAENSTGKKLKALRTDRGSEYVNKAFEAFLAENGIRHDKTAPYTPQQNGVAERANRTIMESARSMLHHRDLPSHLWGEAVATAVLIKNMSPTKSLTNSTPAEAWTGRKPNASYLRVFGCKAFAHVPDVKRKKLEPKSIECVFVGYDMASKAYRLYHPTTRTIMISRDVTFDEGAFVDNLPNVEEQVEPFPLMLPILEEGVQNEVEGHLDAEGGPDEVGADGARAQQPKEGDQPALRRSTRERRPPSPYWIVDRACVATQQEPRNYKEAVGGANNKQWGQAMDSEYQSIMENGTWELVPLPDGRKAVGCKWVYRIKRDANGNIKTWKARLVAKGYSQVEGLDFQEVFAPVAKFTSIRVLFSLAAALEWECHHMDVKTAFLNGELQEEIYMEQPEGYIKQGEEQLVCKLIKSLYGLKQSPRAWNKKLNEELTKAGFARCESDHCVYLKKDETGQVYLLVYVDDLIIIASTKAAMEACKAGLSNTFKMTDLGDTSHFLGMEVQRDRAAKLIHLHQGSYIRGMLERLGMSDCAPLRIPIAVGTKLPPCAEEEQSFRTYFQSAVGSLMYLMVATRPDLAFAVHAVSQFMSSPSEEHLATVKRILRYVKGTMDYKLTLGASSNNMQLLGYSDADWGANDINRRSISGFCFLLGAGAVSWSSKKQTSVALSSTEAEYMALTQASKEAIWIRRLLLELGQPDEPVLINVDNQSCMALAKNPEFHARSKHIDIQYHFIREKVEGGIVKLEFCPTQKMVADVLTKAIPSEKHTWCAEAMGVKSTD